MVKELLLQSNEAETLLTCVRPDNKGCVREAGEQLVVLLEVRRQVVHEEEVEENGIRAETWVL